MDEVRLRAEAHGISHHWQPGGHSDHRGAEPRQPGSRVPAIVGLTIAAGLPFLIGAGMAQEPVFALVAVSCMVGIAFWVTLIAVIMAVARVMASRGSANGLVPGRNVPL